MTAAELIARLFHARTAAHMAHLQTRSFSEHKALDTFYNEIIEGADTFAETYQGVFGLIKTFPTLPLPTGKPAVWIAQLRKDLQKNRDKVCQGDTALESVVDVLLQLFGQTLYKLNYLNQSEEMDEGSAADTDDMASMKTWAKK